MANEFLSLDLFHERLDQVIQEMERSELPSVSWTGTEEDENVCFLYRYLSTEACSQNLHEIRYWLGAPILNLGYKNSYVDKYSPKHLKQELFSMKDLCFPHFWKHSIAAAPGLTAHITTEKTLGVLRGMKRVKIRIDDYIDPPEESRPFWLSPMLKGERLWDVKSWDRTTFRTKRRTR